MNDNYRESMLAIVEELRAQGVRPYTTAPPIYRLAWRMRIRVRPPFYQSFGTIAVGAGVWFTIFWGLFMWLVVWSRYDALSEAVPIFSSLFAGTFFGLTMAIYYRRKAATLRLPPLPESPDRKDLDSA